MNIDVFKSMSDEDFFSDKVQHIYFNSEVNEKSVNELLTKIHQANNPIYINKILIQPKPIIIHISSMGGELEPALKFLTAFKDSKVPICTLVDNYSASAATILSINSPYRLVSDYSLTLIHQYTVQLKGKREKLINELAITENTAYSKLIEMYLKKTKLNKKELNELLKHDLWLNADFCIKKGLADRILKFKKQSHKIPKEYNLKAELLLKQPDFNNVYLECNAEKKNLDKFLYKKDDITTNPIIIHPQIANCTEYENGIYVMTEGLSLISRIRSLKSPTFCIIESAISLDDLLPMLFCTKIFIYDHASVICNLLYFQYKSLLLSDSIKNTNTIFNIIKKILKEKTKLPNKKIEDINNEFVILSPKECLKYGLCHEIIKLY